MSGDPLTAVPDGPGWPVRLTTRLLNPAGTAGRALLLHGLGSDGDTWWWLGSQLADRGYLVVAPDLRSHGASPTAIDHRIATLAEDVAILGDGWDVVVGHSLGGAIAAHLLTRDDLDIAAAVLIEPVLQPSDGDGGPSRAVDLVLAHNEAWDVSQTAARWRAPVEVLTGPLPEPHGAVRDAVERAIGGRGVRRD